MQSVDILGVRVDDVTMSEAIDHTRCWLRDGGDHQIVTPNAEFVVRARSEPSFRQIIANSALSIPDGAGLLLAGRILGTPLREQVAGTDLAVELARLCSDGCYGLFLLGAGPGVADDAAAQLRRRFPGLRIAGTYGGTPSVEDDHAARAAIERAAPVHVLLVAYGAPAQDYWIARNLPSLDVTIAVGVGGALDFIAGRVPRAPAWLRRIGLDWAFRLALQPWRWRRQLALPKFVALAVATAIRQRISYR